MFKKDTIYILKNIFSIISSPLVVWQSSKWVTLAEETCEWKVTLGWLVAMTHREGVMLKGGGGAMWGWGWWLGERDERVGCGGGESGTRSGKSESYGSHHHLKTLENTWRWLVCVGADEDALRVERTRLFFFFFFPPHHRLPVRVSNHESSPNVVQASRRNVDIKLKVGWVPGNVISSSELAHYGWIVVVSLLALIISHQVDALFAAHDAGLFHCCWPQGTFAEKRRICVGCNLILHCENMTTRKSWFYLYFNLIQSYYF